MGTGSDFILRLAKWIGAALVLYVAVIVGLFLLGVVLHLSLLLTPVFLVALPFLIYDLLLRAPRKGESDPPRERE